MSNGNDDTLLKQLDCKLCEIDELVKKCEKWQKNNVEGIGKLRRKIETEGSFFQKLKKNPKKLKACHMTCTNLQHFSAVITALGRYSECVAVLKSFTMPHTNLVVDIVCDQGAQWVKVVARNAKGLHRAWCAGDSRRERNLVDQAEDFLNAAQQHPYMFKQPMITFEFFAGVPERLAEDLNSMGIRVRGDIVPSEQLPNWVIEDSSSEDELDDSASEESDSNDHDGCQPGASSCNDVPVFSSNEGQLAPLNLDITALFAYVSSLTNGGANFRFKEPLLDEQASWERQRAVKPVLEAMMKDRELMCCQTAYDAFLAILATVGGVQEKERAAQFLQTVRILPDSQSARTLQLKLGGKIKQRSKVIFGSGDFYKAVTVTANQGFVHAAAHQGVSFAVLFHESRALSEQKQLCAEALLLQPSHSQHSISEESDSVDSNCEKEIITTQHQQ